MWEDEYGALGPAKPGVGPRNDPRGEFPTGPAVGAPFPDVVATTGDGRTVDVAITLGAILFSGSLYGLALLNEPPGWLGPITPIGGTVFLAGWITLACTRRQSS